MTALMGTYQNGHLKLEREYPSERPVKVIVTFLEETESAERGLQLSDFSFAESRELLKGYTGSLSDAIIEERRAGL